MAKLKIKNKIIIFFIVIYTIYLSVILAFTYVSNKDILESALKDRITQTYYQLSGNISENIKTENTYEIHQKIHSAALNNEVAYIIVFDNEKNILGKTLKEIPQKIATFNDEQLNNFKKYDSSRGEILEYISPIDDVNIGYIRVGFYTKNIYIKTYSQFLRIFILNMSVFVMLLVIAYYVSKLIERPVQDLTLVTDEIIREGDYRTKIEKENYSRDFHVLVSSINEMVENNKKNKKLNNYLLNKIFRIQEEEKKMLSRELHDEVSQSLASLLFLISNLVDKESDRKKKDRLLLIRSEIENSLSNIRNIAVNLRPPSAELSLGEVISKYIEDYKNLYGIDVELYTNYEGGKNNNFDITLYRIIQESLSNIKRHSGATEVQIKLYENTDYIILTIADNGIGLTKERVELAKKQGRLGIYGIQERIFDFSGEFKLLENNKYSTILMCKFKIEMLKEEKIDENIIN